MTKPFRLMIIAEGPIACGKTRVIDFLERMLNCEQSDFIINQVKRDYSSNSNAVPTEIIQFELEGV
jgi:hypothetical protein